MTSGRPSTRAPQFGSLTVAQARRLPASSCAMKPSIFPPAMSAVAFA
jgi:hypothetical protein